MRRATFRKVHSVHRVRVAFVAILAPCLVGCPLPIPRTEALSASLTGIVLGSDGTPVPQADVVVSTEHGDSACARATLRTLTDSMGTFRLPGIQERYGVTWFVPNFDRVAPSYHLCVGFGAAPRCAYQGYGSLAAEPPIDSIVCLQWSWHGGERVTCSGRARQGLVFGGRWADGEASGSYRLIVTEEATPDRRRYPWGQRPAIYVQWVEQSGADVPARVRTTVEVPLGPKVTSLRDVTLLYHDGRSLARVNGTKKTFLNDYASAWIMFELGPPGQVTGVEVH